ncbi:MAG: hypothetical protein C5B53_02205, partial [Candidatus Melainabacteria bacterium]
MGQRLKRAQCLLVSLLWLTSQVLPFGALAHNYSLPLNGHGTNVFGFARTPGVGVITPGLARHQMVLPGFTRHQMAMPGLTNQQMVLPNSLTPAPLQHTKHLMPLTHLLGLPAGNNQPPVAPGSIQTFTTAKYVSPEQLGIKNFSFTKSVDNFGASKLQIKANYFHPNFAGKPFSSLKAGDMVGSPVHLQPTLTGDPQLPSGFDLDLGSRQSFVMANNSHPTVVYIGGYVDGNGYVAGGIPRLIKPGQPVTPAQYVALEQIADTGHQSLVLTAHGIAATGFLTLSPSDVTSLGNLQVPRNVTLNGVGFTPANPLVVTGPSQVYGTLYASGNTANSASVVQTGTLAVGPHGLLSGDASTSPGLSKLVFPSSSLTLNVNGNVLNQGTISSAGKLNINSGGSIVNQSIAGTAGALIKGQTVNLYTGAGNLTNSGSIVATAGDVSIRTAAKADLNVNNAGGLIQASNGAINLRDGGYTGTANMNLKGGDWLSSQLNFNGGTGSVDANLGNVSGVVNATANCAHIGAVTPNLRFGQMNVSGDPTYYNAGGNISLASIPNTNGNDLAVLASGDVTVSGGSINTTQASGAGGNVYIASGVLFVNPTSGSGLPASASTTVTVGPSSSSTGGSIDISGVTGISTQATGSGNAKGGDVFLMAYANGSNGGLINASGVNITSGGVGTGTNGVVYAVGGGVDSANPAIRLGNITTSGGAVGGPLNAGSINIYTAQPTVGGAATTISFRDGSVVGTSGRFTFSPTINANASVSAGNLNTHGNDAGSAQAAGTNGAPINVFAGSAITTGSINTSGGGGGVSVSGNGFNGGNAGAVTLQAGSNLNTGSIRSYGGGGGGAFGSSNKGNGGVGGNGAAVAITTTNGS